MNDSPLPPPVKLFHFGTDMLFLAFGAIWGVEQRCVDPLALAFCNSAPATFDEHFKDPIIGFR